MGNRRGAYRVLLGRPDGKRPRGRCRHRWMQNIKMDLKEVGWRGVNWIDLPQDTASWHVVINAVRNPWVP
jgi:hypothetical protein